MAAHARKIIEAAELRALVRSLDSVVVAFSGGVDSATVLAVAAAELGGRVLAITGRSPALALGEAESAAAIARSLSARHEFLDTREFDNPEYTANPANRCFYCKDELYGRLRAVAMTRGFANLVDGTNADDGQQPLDVRHGHAAARRHGVRSPLAEAGLGKSEVRSLARRLGVPIWDKPATPCLASRVPQGTRVEASVLRRIDLAERYLRARGYSTVRVRHFGTTARIEVPLADVGRLRAMSENVEHALRSIGYDRVEIDERGYRTGSLNERP